MMASGEPQRGVGGVPVLGEMIGAGGSGGLAGADLPEGYDLTSHGHRQTRSRPLPPGYPQGLC